MEFYFAYFTIRLTRHFGFPYIPQYSNAFSSLLLSLMLHLYQTHKIVVFHPVVACLQGLEVTSPWKDPNPKYPSPHNDLLAAHFQTSIFASLSAATEPLDDNNDNEDEDEDDDDYDNDNDDDERELPSNHNNEAVRIWADDPNRYPPAEWRLDNERVDIFLCLFILFNQALI